MENRVNLISACFKLCESFLFASDLLFHDLLLAA